MKNSSARARGSYVLIIRVPIAIAIEVGSLGRYSFPVGYYAYVGSALGGLKARLRRHLNRKKTPRWHIDYLTNIGSIKTILVFESGLRLECRIAEALKQQFSSVPRFGCGDCDCTSHLFFTAGQENMKAGVEKCLL